MLLITAVIHGIMDNTKVLQPNGPLHMPNKVYELNSSPTKKMATGHGKQQSSNGSVYTGAKMLFNKPSIMDATAIQFLPSICNHSTLGNNMRNLPGMSSNSIYLQESGKFPTDKILSTVIESTTKGHTISNTPHEQPANVIENTCHRARDGNVIVNTVKNVLGCLMKPILDTKMKIIGNDKHKKRMEPQPFLNNCSAAYEYYPNHCGDDRFDNSDIEISESIMQLIPDIESVLFFDCEEFVAHSEDTVDFIGHRTKTSCSISSSDSSIYFECNNHFKMDLPSIKIPTTPPKPSDTKQTFENVCPASDFVKIEKISPLGECCTATEPKRSDNVMRCERVQYGDDKPAVSKTKDPVCLPWNNTKRKRRRKQKAKLSSKRMEMCHKRSIQAKNRHEKSRHNLEVDINEDILSWSDADNNDDIVDSDASDVAISIELIDMESIKPLEVVIPEEVPADCIFKYFYRLASPLKGLTSIPAHLLARLAATSTKYSQHKHSCSVAKKCEPESDDSFIMFDDDSDDECILSMRRSTLRQRNTSECSDDFIVFHDDTIDGDCSYIDTFEEDYTDSTDSSDESDDSDEENDEDESDSGEVHAKLIYWPSTTKTINKLLLFLWFSLSPHRLQ